MIHIHEARVGDIPMLYDFYNSLGKHDDGYFEYALEKGTSIYMIEENGTPAGFCLLNWTPRYALYSRLGIPEIQDLNILPAFRRRGLATALIKWCEGVARAKGKETIGIGVGLTADYGPAQILYTNLGYVPDGHGVTYDRMGVNAHQSYPMDDNLSLMMVKPL